MQIRDKTSIQYYPTSWHTRNLATAVSFNNGFKLLSYPEESIPLKTLADDKIVRLVSGEAVDNTALIQAARELIHMGANNPVDEGKNDSIILFMSTIEEKEEKNNLGNYKVPYDVAKLFGQDSKSYRTPREPDKSFPTVSAHIFSSKAWEEKGICRFESEICRYFELLATTVENRT